MTSDICFSENVLYWTRTKLGWSYKDEVTRTANIDIEVIDIEISKWLYEFFLNNDPYVSQPFDMSSKVTSNVTRGPVESETILFWTTYLCGPYFCFNPCVYYWGTFWIPAENSNETESKVLKVNYILNILLKFINQINNIANYIISTTCWEFLEHYVGFCVLLFSMKILSHQDMLLKLHDDIIGKIHFSFTIGFTSHWRKKYIFPERINLPAATSLALY